MSDPATIPTEPVEPIDWDSAILETARRMGIAFHRDERVPPQRTLEGARLAWEAIYGHLRGRVPYPVPPDLLGVAVSASLRIAKGFAFTGTMFLQNGNFNGTADLRPWAGFMLVEKVTLNRYRQRTA
ncbi:hypothetical protein GCM10022237_48620 [Nocardioides ginsengisoli]|uniref:Uncharacterized protein n=1 Tax=Nocardioides ginsengisoli TaxID=363868 RepID=A0ABW3W1Q1_9ACTN